MTGGTNGVQAIVPPVGGVARMRRLAPSTLFPRARPVMQMLLRTHAASEAGRAFAAESVLDWAEQRWPGRIPRTAWRGIEFEIDEPGFEIGVVNVADRETWGFRVEHLGEGGRVWQVEAVVSASKQGFDIVGVRSQCTTSGGEDVPATTPKFVRAWLERLQLVDGDCPVFAAPLFISEPTEIDSLVSLLTSAIRRLPVVVVSQLNNGSGYVIDPERLTRRTLGLAHVVALHSDQSAALIDRIGRDSAVFNGAVRTYRPGFGQLVDAQVHPNVLPARMATWAGTEGSGPGAFLEFLVNEMHRFSVATPAKLDQLPGFLQMRGLRAERERKEQQERLRRLQEELATRAPDDLEGRVRVLEAQLDERKLELELAGLERDQARLEAEEATALFNEQAIDLAAAQQERDALRSTNAGLFAGLRRLKASRADEERLPEGYDQFAEWVDETLSDRLILLPRARRNLKSARFDDVGLVAKSLQLLANEYWSLRTADPENFAAARQAFESRLRELELDESPSISDSRAGEAEEQYFVSYSIRHTSRQMLDRHLRGGSNTKDDRYCLRIYFFWDDDQQKVVIGHLPNHLDTRAS